jgi:hypothetical protein
MFSRSNASYREVPVDPSRAVAMSTMIGQPTRHLVDDDAPAIADYDYPAVHDRNTCKCRGGRLVGRINIMREVAIPDGEQHPHYPGLRTRICCVIPAGWPMLFMTIGLILVPSITMLLNIHPTAAYYGWFLIGTSSVLSIITLFNVAFRDPGVFPRYLRSMGDADKWARFEKTNSFRCVRECVTRVRSACLDFCVPQLAVSLFVFLRPQVACVPFVVRIVALVSSVATTNVHNEV